MTPVRRRDLAVVAVGLALATWLVVRSVYGDLPPLRWWLPVPLALLAVTEGLAARTLGARLDAVREARRTARGGAPEAATAHRPGLVRPVEPLLVARVAVLAQASAYMGAVFVGVWTGVLLYVVPSLDRLDAAGDDTVTGVVGVLSSAALVVAALWLEHVCRVPPSRDDEGGAAAARGAGR
ncbi:DUF3180 domain-containing protein [Trujillonella endophytica]|uniref:DUF3180 domain-containing protein n=1 Tax=Trujillonella endophytica TaxID=673521 RepID=A0A1H8V0P8_9ACTN|nr:DUF3180 domain-containing protein [Trujillella endophytica]SEP08774.1 Protein of unknown function [Trujillella endophytica]